MTPIENGDMKERMARAEQRLHDIREPLSLIPQIEAALMRLENQGSNIRDDVADGAAKLKALEERLEADRRRHEAEEVQRRKDAEAKREADEEKNRSDRRFLLTISCAAVASAGSITSIVVAIAG